MKGDDTDTNLILNYTNMFKIVLDTLCLLVVKSKPQTSFCNIKLDQCNIKISFKLMEHL